MQRCAESDFRHVGRFYSSVIRRSLLKSSHLPNLMQKCVALFVATVCHIITVILPVDCIEFHYCQVINLFLTTVKAAFSAALSHARK